MGLGSDAVMFLVGRGLTDWLLQDAEHGMFLPPHAVPSLAGTAITDRTVMARMKIAEYNAVPSPLRRLRMRRRELSPSTFTTKLIYSQSRDFKNWKPLFGNEVSSCTQKGFPHKIQYCGSMSHL